MFRGGKGYKINVTGTQGIEDIEDIEGTGATRTKLCPHNGYFFYYANNNPTTYSHILGTVVTRST